MTYFTTERQTRITSALFCAVVLCVSFVSEGGCQTTPSPTTACSTYKTCDTCVPHAKCLWCLTNNNCTDYPVSWLLPPASVCKLSQARWGVCWMNFEALIIALAVLCGTILISITVCCCCCCCCNKRRSGNGERKARHDEIRRKYGLIGDADHPYSKFENE
ncbi:pituitary tumor-transforming gene 1 protein-interacting protein isoform X2 [Acanthopagrus latus]|uniref:pituitary tumor-transforming gene 1 protein-interacting protein isoform X2 n=1 Tax=Acanthopagrus latus TaxID=8177 RepID=UPI00187C9324|nr:pituitary tumor-transforming gene 1 protein-interacting protein isoform X2 [Acanthopagrus latus]